MAEVEVGGVEYTREIEGTPKLTSITTVRLNTSGSLDVVVTADGTSNVLAMLKLIAQEIVDMSIPTPLPAQWSQIVKVPTTGTEVTVSFGVRSEYSEDAP